MKKASFKDNPAFAFTGLPVTEKPERPAVAGQAQTKTRLNIALRPVTYEAVKKLAHIEQISINEIIGRLIDSHAAENAEKMRLFDEITGKGEK